MGADERFKRVPIIVLDGSDIQDEQDANFAFSSQFGAAYCHAPHDDFYRRVIAGLKTVTTDYVQLLGDDDFINLNALFACADFLDAHADYAACRGHYALFRSPAGENDPLILRVDKNRSIASYEHESPFERLFWAMLEPFPVAIYSLHRTTCLADIFVRAARCARNSNTAQVDYFVSDPLMLSLSVIAGKVGNVQTPILLREIGHTGVTRPLFGEKLLESGSSVAAQYALAKTEMLTALPGDIDRDAASEALDAVWGLFVSLGLSPRRMGSKLTKALKKIYGVERFPLFRRNKPKKGAIRAYPLEIRESGGELADDERWIRDYEFAIRFLANHQGIAKIQVIDTTGIHWTNSVKLRFPSNE